MQIRKSGGGTRTERLLAELCDRSFLKLWSYANPFNDERKELCDLLAVFDDHVFIFFDRESRILDDTKKDQEVTWERWKRIAVEEQIETAKGAEKYIKSGRAVFLDNTLPTRFPINFDHKRAIIHKIIVAHGAKEACERSSSKNVSGSLAISYGPPDRDTSFPFLVELDAAWPVHVLDSHSLEIVLGELDTFYDLSRYFQAKYDALQKFKSLVYCGEEDLVAHYLYSFDEKSQRHFIGPKKGGYDFVMIGEGEWKDFTRLDIYVNRKALDQASYCWDRLIQKTSENALSGRLQGNSKPFEGQSAIYEMAKEPRFWRRALCEKIRQVVTNFPEDSAPGMRTVSLIPSFFPDKCYVFLQLKSAYGSDDDHVAVRREMLGIACGAAKNRFPQFKTIVGIAIDSPKYVRQNAEDLILMNCAKWTDEDRRHYEEANSVLGFFQSKSLKMYHETTAEFPHLSGKTKRPARSKKIGRNEGCPCGSGRKYKHCHGRR